MKNVLVFLILLLLTNCNQSQHKNEKANSPKGELAFLLQYNNRLPSDVGFLTNHIVERRIANLTKGDFEKFIAATQYEKPLHINENLQQAFAVYLKDNISNKISATVTVDVSKDAFWVDYYENDSLKSFADYPSEAKPNLP